MNTIIESISAPVPIVSTVPLPVLRANDIASAKIFITPVTAINGVLNKATWTNNSGLDIYITKLWIWVGVGKGQFADVTAALYRTTDGSVMGEVLYDRYADPSLPGNVVQFDYRTAWKLAANESLTLNWIGNPITPPVGASMQASVAIVFQVNP